MISEGDKVPDFELQDQDGKTVKSSSLRGSKCAIYFYPKDFTPGCTTEADEFSKGHGGFAKAGVRVIGISPDGPASHKKFCSKMGIPYTLLADTDKKAARAFGVWGKKKFMGREYMGVSRSTFLVDEGGTVFKAYQSVRAKGHAAEVLACFKEQ